MFAVGRPRLRVRALVVVPIMALVMAMVMVLAACSGSVQGNGSLNATPLAPNSTLPVIGDGHTSFDQLAKNALADVMTFWQTNYPLISGGKPLPPI